MPGLPLPPSPLPLYDEVPVFRTEHLPVGDGHTLQVTHAGTAGRPVALLLHGGPGSGQSPLLRRAFDPARWHVVAPDQRGAGGSTPRGGLAANTTPHLLADLRRLHRHLGAPRWLVVGGSWGATLAVAHAADLPDAVGGLLLRASFLGRNEDVAAFLDPAVQAHDPTGRAAWAKLCTAAGLPAAFACDPTADRLPATAWMVAALADRLAAEDAEAAQAVALAWWRWERLQASLPPAAPPSGDALAAQVDRLRVQSHYLRHGCWLRPPDQTPLLDRVPALPRVPTLLLHADNDRICPPPGAAALLAALHDHGHTDATLHWVPGAGHDPAHPAMAAAYRQALDHFAEHGRWPGAPSEDTAP